MQSIAVEFIQIRIHLVFVLTQSGKTIDRSPFVIGADAVEPKNEVRDLGLILDSDLSMTTHITGLVRTSFVILRQRRSVSRSLTQDATRQCRHLVQSLILSRIDYCNVAFAGLPQRSFIRLQAVINAAARLVLRLKKFEHISTAIQDELQWLRVYASASSSNFASWFINV